MWVHKKLGEICEITSSKRIFYSEYADCGIPFYRSKEIIEKSLGKMILSPLYIDISKYDEIKQKYGVPKKDDILITSVGTIGTCYIVKDKDLPFYFKDGNLTWINKYNNVMPKYLYYLLISKPIQNKISQNLIGSTQQALTISALKSLNVFITTDINEQQSIADVLSSFDDKIELNNKIIKNLEEQAQSLYKHWFVDFEFPDKDGKPYKSNGGKFKESELGLIPEDWEVKNIDQLTIINSRGISPLYSNNHDTAVINQKCIRSGLIDATELTYNDDNKTYNSNLILKFMDTLVNSMGVGTLGRISPYLLKIKAVPHSCVTLLRNEIIPTYLYCAVKNLEDRITLMGTGTTGQTSLNNKQLGQLNVVHSDVLANEFEQAVICHYKKISELLVENQKLIEMRDYLLPKLMNGEIKVNEIKK